jgi:hypothetical protein
MMVFNRLCDPCSKLGMLQWLQTVSFPKATMQDVAHTQLLGHGSRLGLCHARLQPDEPVSSGRILRSKIQHTLSTLHGLVLAIGGSWHHDASQSKLMLSVPRRKLAWFSGLCANASTPPVIHGLQ